MSHVIRRALCARKTDCNEDGQLAVFFWSDDSGESAFRRGFIALIVGVC